MILFNALTRGAIAFLSVMSLGICGLMLRDGVSIDGMTELWASLPDAVLQGTIDIVKSSFQQGVGKLM